MGRHLAYRGGTSAGAIQNLWTSSAKTIAPGRPMPISTVKQLCIPSAVVTSDSLVEQVAQIEDFASGKVDAREFFRRNYFTAGLELLVKRGFDRLAGKSEDGAFYLTQAMGGGKTHSLIAFGLLASDPALRREVAPKLTDADDFGAAKVVIFNGHQNPETLLWGYLAEKIGKSEVMAPFWRNGAKTPGVDEWVNVLATEPILILLDELPSYLQMAQGEPVGATTLGELTIGALERLFNALPRCQRACVVVTNLKDDVYLDGSGQLRTLIESLTKHYDRNAQAITPVQQNTGEIFAIVRKRLFDGLPWAGPHRRGRASLCRGAPEGEAGRHDSVYARDLHRAHPRDVPVPPVHP